MPFIARSSTYVFDYHVEGDYVSITNDSDFDGVPSVYTASVASLTCAGEQATQNEARSLDADVLVERSGSPGGRSEQEPERDEDRSSTMGEREEPSSAVRSQTPTSVEDTAQESDDDVTLIGDHDEEDAEDPWLSVVDFDYEDMLTPEQLSDGYDQDDTQSEFAVSYDSDEDEGPVAIGHTEDGAPYVSVDFGQRRTRTRPDPEEDDNSAFRTLATGPSAANAYRGPVIAPVDATHAPMRTRSTSNLRYALDLRLYTSSDYASLRGVPTPPRSLSRRLLGYADEEEDGYESEEEDEEQDGYEEEEVGEVGAEWYEEYEEYDPDLLMHPTVAFVEGVEDEEQSEDEGTVVDGFWL